MHYQLPMMAAGEDRDIRTVAGEMFCKAGSRHYKRYSGIISEYDARTISISDFLAVAKFRRFDQIQARELLSVKELTFNFYYSIIVYI
jgi:hypothetical protein